MIFNLFKAKPTLEELIPNGFVDIHSHILPGIDDGPRNFQESKKLILEIEKLGFSKIIATPHVYPGLYNNTNKSIQKVFHQLNEDLNTNVKISYAAEYMLEKDLFSSAKLKNLLCLKDKMVLVEMSYISKPTKLYDIIFELKVNDFIPVLAHPERYLFLNNNFNEYKRLKKFGCKFQFNLLSAVGYYGKEVVVILEKLLKNGMIDFAGSDIHNINHINRFAGKLVIKNFKMIEQILDDNKYFL